MKRSPSSTHTTLATLAPLATLAALAILAGCATGPNPFTITEATEVRAAVTQLDLATRMITLKGPAGNEFTFEVDEAVRNLPQVRVGDNVVVRYYESIGAALRVAGDPTEATVELSDARAEAGKRPGAAITDRVTIPVSIVAVDTATNVVTFYGSDKRVRTLAVRTPEGRAFIAKLKPGNEVIITFTEALAVSVEPAT